MASRKTNTAAKSPAASAAPAQAPAINSALLIAINSATLGGGFLYANEFDATALVSLGYVEINREMRNETGEVAARSTEAGKALAASLGSLPAAPAPGGPLPAPQPPLTQPTGGGPKFAILKGITVPQKTRVRGREERYPFASMEVGDGFHVPATADVPEPAKTLQSTVSSANARFAIEAKDAAGNVIMENKTVSEAVRGADGNVMRDATGKLIRHTVVKTGPKLEYPRRFAVFATDANYRDAAGNVLGEGAIVTRTK
jgi:hypothetical protein